MHPLPTFNRVYSLIVQQERQILGDFSDTTKVLINNAFNLVGETSRPPFKGSHNNKCSSFHEQFCTFRKKKGHTENICYKKNGFAQGFKFKNQKY
jgi:hypothetical protein